MKSKINQEHTLVIENEYWVEAEEIQVIPRKIKVDGKLKNMTCYEPTGNIVATGSVWATDERVAAEKASILREIDTSIEKCDRVQYRVILKSKLNSN